MKPLRTIFIILMMLISLPLFAVTDDYISGYKQGYSDALQQKPNQYSADISTQQNSQWIIKYYVDEFGDPTDEGYITQKSYSSGTFSNSATTNSELKWYFLIDNDSASISLREYGSYVVKGDYDGDLYNIRIKTEEKTYDLRGINYSDRIRISNSPETLLKILNEGKKIKIAISEESRYSHSTYNLGEFDCYGFSEIFKELNP